MTKLKRVLAIVLTIAALLSTVPAGALAAEAEPVEAAETAEAEEAAVSETEPEESQPTEAEEPVTEAEEPAEEAQEPATEAQEPAEEQPAEESVAEQEPTEAQEPVEPADEEEAPEEVLSVETDTGSVKRLLGGSSIKDAIVIKAGEQVENLFPVGSGDSKDYYKLTLASSGTLTISGSSKVYPLELELLDSKGNAITSFPGVDLEEKLALEMTKGTYYLVFKKTGSSSGVYSFVPAFTAVNETVAETNSGTNNTKDKASTMSLNTPVVGHFSITDSVDWYQFKLDKPGQIRFDATTKMSAISYTVVAKNGFTALHLDTEQDHITGENKVTNKQIDLIAGTYYVCVESATATGKYTFQVKFTASNETFPDSQGSCKNSFATASYVLANTTYNGQIAENSDADYYKFIISEDKAAVTLIAATKMPKATYRVYNSSKVLCEEVESSWKSSSTAGTVSLSLPLSKGTYYLVVEGADSFTGAYSFQLKCKTQFAPVIRKATNENGDILLQWENYGAEKYRIFLRSSGNWTAVGTVTGTSFRYTKVTSGKDYNFTIRAVNKAETKYTSSYDGKGVTIRYIAPPVLKPVVNQINGARVYWKASAGAAKYAVFYRVPKGKWSKIGTTTGTDFVFTKAKDGTTYEFTVRCVSADGTSYTSAYDTKGVSVTFLSAPKITTAVPETSGIHLAWSKSSGAVNFRVFYKVSGKWIKLGNTTKTDIVLKGLATGKSYTFTVRSMDKAGKAYTSGYDATGVNVTYLAVPTLLDPTVTANSAELKWKAVTGAAYYRVYYKEKGAKSWTRVGDYKTTNCTLKDLKSKKDYVFTVRCISADKKAYTSGYNTSGKAFKTK